MVESTSMNIGASPGPAPAAHARVSAVSVTASSWRMCPNVNDRSHVPTVEAATVSCPRPLAGRPGTQQATSSMQSPPASSVSRPS
jgi:hypothetical protein